MLRWEEPTGLPFIGLAAGGFLAIGMIMITVMMAALSGSTWWVTLYTWTAAYYLGWCVVVIIASIRRVPAMLNHPAEQFYHSSSSLRRRR